MKHDKASMNHQRRMLALTGFLLPILSTIPGFIAGDRNAFDFWFSISATFYATSCIFMIMTLGRFSGYLFTYEGYDLGDKATCRFSATMAYGIVLFPCSTSAAGPTTGVFNLPTPISHVIHCIIAALLFGSFAYMIGFRFTKTNMLVMTEQKKKKNRVYRICACIIVAAMLCQVATSILDIKWFTIINETIMLWSFSFAWAVKSDMVKKWIDE